MRLEFEIWNEFWKKSIRGNTGYREREREIGEKISIRHLQYKRKVVYEQ